MLEGGVVDSRMESRVDVDVVVCTVPFVEVEEDLSVRKLALDRRRNSLKKDIVLTGYKQRKQRGAHQRLADLLAVRGRATPRRETMFGERVNARRLAQASARGRKCNWIAERNDRLEPARRGHSATADL